jgi:hypothetical protein
LLSGCKAWTNCIAHMYAHAHARRGPLGKGRAFVCVHGANEKIGTEDCGWSKSSRSGGNNIPSKSSNLSPSMLASLKNSTVSWWPVTFSHPATASVSHPLISAVEKLHTEAVRHHDTGDVRQLEWKRNDCELVERPRAKHQNTTRNEPTWKRSHGDELLLERQLRTARPYFLADHGSRVAGCQQRSRKKNKKGDVTKDNNTIGPSTHDVISGVALPLVLVRTGGRSLSGFLFRYVLHRTRQCSSVRLFGIGCGLLTGPAS